MGFFWGASTTIFLLNAEQSARDTRRRGHILSVTSKVTLIRSQRRFRAGSKGGELRREVCKLLDGLCAPCSFPTDEILTIVR